MTCNRKATWGFILLLSLCLAVPAAAVETATYIYDAMDRLTQVTYNDGTTITYTYDKMGNRLTETVAPAAAAPEAQGSAAPAAAGPGLPLRALPSPGQGR